MLDQTAHLPQALTLTCHEALDEALNFSGPVSASEVGSDETGQSLRFLWLLYSAVFLLLISSLIPCGLREYFVCFLLF